MKNFFLLILAIATTIQAGYCELSSNNVNLFNLKEKNVYMLTLPEKVKEFNIMNEKSINITPITSINNDKRILIVEAKGDGVSDVSIRTENSLYQIRFVIGPEFQIESTDLIMIDLPSVLIGGK